ncbi:MAG: hypothetical protein LBL50_05040, partial [Candidatus Margulisbacteria bacterium]|nr:hypothetical protein [Candidatus Margulisiibacteriota bacterium]
MRKSIWGLVFIFAALSAEISLSGGLTQGRQLQTVSGAENYRAAAELTLRPAYFAEFDSVGHALFLANDHV